MTIFKEACLRSPPTNNPVAVRDWADRYGPMLRTKGEEKVRASIVADREFFARQYYRGPVIERRLHDRYGGA